MTLSNRQRYYIRRRGGGSAAIYLAVKKDLLKSEQLYTEHVKKLLSEGEISSCLPNWWTLHYLC